MNPDIYEIQLIGNGSLSAMAKPDSSECIDDVFAAIANRGTNRIVSLLETSEALEAGLGSEQQLAEKYEMEFVHFPIRDRGLPQSHEDYLSFTKRLYNDAAGGLDIVVHCWAGIGRTGMVTAGVLLHCGFEPLAAIEHISKKRGVAVPDTQEQIDWVIDSHAVMQSI